MKRLFLSIGIAVAVALPGSVSVGLAPAVAAPVRVVAATLPDGVDPAECPEVTPGTFGAEPAGPLAGGDCRRLTVPAGGHHLIRAVDDQNDFHRAAVYGADGERICDSGYCDLPAAGTYTLMVTTPTTPFATVLLPLSADGCETASDQGFSEPVRRPTLGVGQVACLQLPGAEGYYQVSTPDKWAATAPRTDLVRSAPTTCVQESTLTTSAGCRIHTDGPLRLLVTPRYGQPLAEYQFAVQRMTAPTGCADLPPGRFGEPGGAIVPLSADRHVVCYRIPEREHAAREILTVAGRGGTSGPQIQVYDNTGREVCGQSVASLIGCRLTATGDYTAVVRARGVTGDHRVSRVDATGANCAEPASTKFGGVPSTGLLDEPGEIHCYRTPPAWIRAGDESSRPAIRYFDVDGELRGCANSSCLIASGAIFLSSRDRLDYRVDTWGTGAALGLTRDCAPDDGASVAYGFSPVVDVLTAADRAYCRVVPVAEGDEFLIRVGAAGSLRPYLFSRSGEVSACTSVTNGYRCVADLPAGQTTGFALFAVVGDAVTKQVQFSVTGTCAIARLCGGEKYSLFADSAPIKVTAGGQAAITVFGNALHVGDRVSLTRAGHAAIPAVVRSVPATRSSLVAEVDLTRAAPGRWNVQAYSYRDGAGTLTGRVEVAPAPRLTSTSKPSVTGRAAVGLTVRATTGGWSPKPSSVRYQWTANGAAIKGATGSTYKIPVLMRGKRIAVIVTARATGRSDTSATSAAVTVGHGVAPKATTKPKISGTTKAGRTVKVKVGAWSPSATSYKYVWKLNGKTIKGATGSKLKLKKSWKGKKLTVVVTAKRTSHFDGKATSKAVKVK